MPDTFPLVSVVIPSYNHSAYIAQTINSVFNQTYPNLELLVIDDGSSDGSDKLIAALAHQYDFKYIIRENKGLCKTLNESLSHINGEFVCFLASDDLWFQDKLEKQVRFLTERPAYGLVCHKVKFVTKEGKVQDNIAGTVRNEKELSFENLFRRGNKIAALSVMYRKEALDKIGQFDESLRVEDYDMWLRAALITKIGYINEALGAYRLHETNTSTDFEKMKQDLEKILAKYKEHPLYPAARTNLDLMQWSHDARHNKLRFLKQSPHYFKYLGNQRFFQAWFYYFFR